jgi:DHA2 family multidrug resistance protein
LPAFGSWLTAGWDLQISEWTVIWTGIVMSLGYGLIFPNTSAAALSCVAPQRIGNAASLFNMLRNTGAAIGVALMTNSLLSRQQVHQSRLVEHFSVFEPADYAAWDRICRAHPHSSICRSSPVAISNWEPSTA